MPAHPATISDPRLRLPFAAALAELERSLHAAHAGTRLVLLEGPPDVGMDEVVRLVVARARGLVVRARARPSHPLAPLEDLVARVRELRRRGAAEAQLDPALGCVDGCHELWFDHGGAPSSIPWDRLAERRASLFDAVARLLAELDAPPVVVLDDVEHLDRQTAALLACLLEQESLGVRAPGALFVARTPPEVVPALEPLRAMPGVHRVIVRPLTVDELSAYLARPETAAELHARTGGLLGRLHALLRGDAEAPHVTVGAARADAPPDDTPGDADVALRAADLLVSRHAPEEAERVLAEAAERNGAEDRLLVRLMELRGALGDVDGAIEVAERLRSRGDHEGDLCVGRLWLAAGRSAEARPALERAMQRGTPAVRREAALELARLAMQGAEYDTAVSLARAVLGGAALDATAMEARNVLGNVAWIRGALAEAERLHLENRRDAGAHAGILRKALNNLALVELSRGRSGAARALLEQSCELARGAGAARDQGIALENLGVVARVDGRYADAIAHYQAAVRLLKPLNERPLLTRVATNLAETHVTLGDVRGALALVELAERMMPSSTSSELRAQLSLTASEARDLAGEATLARATAQEALAAARGLGEGRIAARASIWLATLEERAGERELASARLDGLGEVASIRDRARSAALRARLARGTDGTLAAARLAVELALQAGEENLELDAHVVHAEALLDAGRVEDAVAACAEAQALADRIRARVPAALRACWDGKPVLVQLSRVTERARTRCALPPRDRPTVQRIVGSSPAMQQLRGWIARVAPTTATVLLAGESGTGKELLAEAVHELSPRRDGPFVRVNCGALVESLRESELFGHERGAFTGADRQRAGYFELAHGGTLFLDEIGETPPAMQAALLRVLQERTFHRVGGVKPIAVDVRIVAATNRDLEQMVERGTFRGDLYFRLRGLTLLVPPLRQRRGDLPELVRTLLERIRAELGLSRLELDASGLERLARYDWPGNVRELEGVLRSVAVLSGASVIDAALIDEHTALGEAAGPASGLSLTERYIRELDARGSIYELRRELERAAIARAFAEAGGNISKAAARLGMKRPRLSALVREYGLKQGEEGDA